MEFRNLEQFVVPVGLTFVGGDQLALQRQAAPEPQAMAPAQRLFDMLNAGA